MSASDPPRAPVAGPPSRPCVTSALRDAGVDSLDDRGLMPLAEARGIVRESRRFHRGEARAVGETMVLESDTLWAALLSLEDAAEFVKEGSRLSWEFHVRGRFNVAPLERYGDAILPWLRSRLRTDGVLVNVPWCVVPCLLAIPGREALDLALATHAVHDLLPDQPPLGGGPGAFAAPGEAAPAASGVRADADAVHASGKARAFLSPTEGLDLARRWLAANPAGFGALAELASEGNERAVALLRDRARALGGVVQEALVAAFGEARAAELSTALDLPRVELPPAVRAVLAEAPIDETPRGPVGSILAGLDDAAREYSLTLWDNLNYTTGAMRVTGFASASGDVLTVESLESSPLQSESLRWRMCAYGPGATKQEASEPLVPEEEVTDPEVDNGEVGLMTNHIVFGHGVVPAPFPFAYQILGVKRALSEAKPEEYRVGYQLPASFAALPAEVREKLRHGVLPFQAMFFRLCDEHADRMWPEDAALLQAAGGPEGARVLFRFESLAWPEAGQPASSSDDLVALTEALRTRRAIRRLPCAPNTRPEHWLRFPDEIEPDDPNDLWGGEEPLPAPPGNRGIGINPYWSDVLARGWPHGVILMHGQDWNPPKQAEQTVRYLLGASAPAMHVFWPRRAACLFLRAVGGLQAAYAPKDPGAVKGMASDAILDLDEAGAFVRGFAARTFAIPPHVGAEVVGLLEALVGGPELVGLFAEALEATPSAWLADRPALAAAVFELGFVLRRIRKGADAQRRKLARAFSPSTNRSNDVGRALDLVLHGRAGAERSARAELDYVHAVDDPAWARERITDPATAASPIDAALYALGGDALLDKWSTRLEGASDPAAVVWAATQIGVLRGDRALALGVQLYAQHEGARNALKMQLAESEEAPQALERLRGGPHGAAAQELLAALRAEGAEDSPGAG
jgi:hypothetical protein